MKLLLIFIGYLMGINFPDIDHKIKFLGHRSFLTHSPIITFVLYYFAKKNGMIEFNYLLTGFSFAIGIHLVFDFFPKAWTGGSIIKPFGGVLFSKIYIFVSALLSFVFSLRIVNNSQSYLMIILMGFIPMFIYSKKERTFLRPMLTYALMVFILGNFYFDEFTPEIMNYISGFVKMLKV